MGSEDFGLSVDNGGMIDLVSGALDNDDYDGATFDLNSGSTISGAGTLGDPGSFVAKFLCTSLGSPSTVERSRSHPASMSAGQGRS